LLLAGTPVRVRRASTVPGSRSAAGGTLVDVVPGVEVAVVLELEVDVVTVALLLDVEVVDVVTVALELDVVEEVDTVVLEADVDVADVVTVALELDVVEDVDTVVLESDVDVVDVVTVVLELDVELVDEPSVVVVDAGTFVTVAV
jgi:hypothetical protein